MKANELSTGDIVWYGDCVHNIGGDYDVVFSLKRLTLDDFRFFAENDWTDRDFNEFIKPVELTGEILQRYGFKQTTDNPYWDYGYTQHDGTHDVYMKAKFINTRGIDCCELSFYTFGIMSCTIESVKIRYVHELQRMLGLCGIKMEFEI